MVPLLLPLVALQVLVRVIQTSQDGTSATQASWQHCYPQAVVKCFSDHDITDLLASTRWQHVWHRLTGVQQADVFRYWYLYWHGGIYADTDAACHRPLPPSVLQKYALVVGLESFVTDAALADYVKMLPGGQYVQWTFAAAPRQPVLKGLLDFIYDRVPAQRNDDEAFTLHVTGPWAFSRAVKQDIANPRLMVLPQVAFACNGYSSPPCNGEHYVQHHFAGSWRVGL